MKKIGVIFIGIGLTFPICSQHFSHLYNHQAPKSVLDGSSKSFLVTGYSTSHRPTDRPWPTILQEMLTLHAGNDTTYYVFKHTLGGTPIAKWTNICGTGIHIQNAISYYINPASNIPSGIPVPSIMLAQQSLQWAFGDCNDRFSNIENPSDTVRIKKGAEAIQSYCNSFIDAGIEKVYMATHIYKTGNYPLNLYGERWALAKAISESDNLYPGPELFNITKQLFPDGFALDKVHPDTEVATMMAVYWYLVLAGENANMSIAQQYSDSAGITLNSTLSKNLVAYWPFNEIEGDIAFDSTKNHLDGQIHSADRISWNKGHALDFDGVEDYVGVIDFNNNAPKQISILNKGTISFWFKYEDIYNGSTVPQSLPIFYYGQSADDTPQNGLEIYIGHNNLTSQQKLYFTVHKNGEVQLCFNNPTNIKAGQWYHYAVAVDSVDHRGYINGVEFNKNYNAGTTINHHGFFATAPEEYNDLLTIGYGRFSSNKFWHFNGAIDEFMIFDKALNFSEIQDIYGGTTVIENLQENNEFFKVYPNPGNGLLNIILKKRINDFSVMVSNQTGQIVSRSENQKYIDFSNQPEGIYFILIQTETQIFTRKIIITK